MPNPEVLVEVLMGNFIFTVKILEGVYSFIIKEVSDGVDTSRNPMWRVISLQKSIPKRRVGGMSRFTLTKPCA